MQAYKAGDFQTAAAFFERALVLEPGDDVYRRNLANARNALGNEAYDRDDLEAAIAFYRRALETNPTDANIRCNLEVTEGRLRVQQENRRRWEGGAEGRARARDLVDGLITKIEQGKDPFAESGGESGSGIAFPGSSAAAAGGSGPLAFPDPNPAPPSDSSVVYVPHVDPDNLPALDPKTLRTVDSEQLAAIASTGEGAKANPRTEVLLTALEVGDTDWTRSYAYLVEKERQYPDAQAITDAKNYLLGLTVDVESMQPEHYRRYYREMLAAGVDPPTRSLDVETSMLMDRADAALFKDPPNYGYAVRLLREAEARKPDNREIRARRNFVEGVAHARRAGIKD